MRERQYIFKRESVSTNTELKDMIRASEEPVFAVISASRQLSGRGRNGKSFYSPDGGIYFSASFPLNGDEPNVPFLTLIAGLTVCTALQRVCPEKLYIKWPNDVYLRDRKLCGILTELTRGAAVVGIGINSETSAGDLKGALGDIATSLKAEGFCAPDRRELIKDIVGSLDRQIYEDGALYADTRKTVEEINGRFYLKNKYVKLVSGNKTAYGTALGTAPSGAVVLLTENGEEEFVSGELSPAPGRFPI